MPIVVGETIGPYRITEQLGQGGMATVFKAYHASLDRYVAIKALHPAFKEDVNFLARFQREARVVARLDHANIVPIYDSAEHEGRPYLVMKYIQGETLKARLGHKQLSMPDIVRVVEAVGAALTYAHHQGILHRDVKPSNVLLADEGQIYLADFGLARIASAGESTMSSDMMLGTPQYISPEQAMGKRNLDEGTDIYSFGVLLYELLVGKVPFSADTPYAIIHDHIYSPLPLPRAINPAISDEMERMLLKALAKERGDRFATVSALVEAFKHACRGLDAAAGQIETGATQVAGVPVIMPETKVSPPAGSASGWEAPAPFVPTATEEISSGQAAAGPEVPAPVPLAPASAGVFDTDQVETMPEVPAPPSAQSPIPEVTEPEAPQPAGGNASLHTVIQLTSREGATPSKPLYKRWYVWLICVVGILGLCMCAWFGKGFLKLRQKVLNPVVPTATLAPQEVNVPLDAVQSARQKVNENPDEPNVHLELAVLLIQVQQYDDVLPELVRVEELMGDFGFYVDHGKLYREQQRWIASAWAFLHAMELNPEWRAAEAIDLWHEAVYKAFQNPNTGRIIDLERIRVIDADMAGVARAQSELAAGNTAKAEAVILEVLKGNDKFTEGLLMQARVLAKMKNTDRVVKILDNLKRIETLPPWIREEILRIEQVDNPKP